MQIWMASFNITLRLIFIGLLFCVSASGQPATRPKIFKAGAATSNVTPALGVGIVGNFETPLATHIHDELNARCLVLDDGTTKLAFVVVDNLSVSREVFDEAKRLAQVSTGIPAQNMMMSATHTHSGPSARGTNAFVMDAPFDSYQTFLAKRIADGVKRAANNLQPARIGYGSGSLPQHVFNRRWKMKPGTKMTNPFGGEDKVVMNPGVGNPNLLEPAGPTDPQVSFISVQATNGVPLALLANYSLHYVGGVPNGHISADYFAVFCQRIGELLQANQKDVPFVGLLANGTCGDVNNINFAGPRESNPPYAKMRVVAEDLAEEVLRIYPRVQHREWAELKAAQSELALAMRIPTPEQVAYAKEVLARPPTISPIHRYEKAYAERTLSAAKWPKEVNIVLQAFRIGDVAVAGIPFETFAETGLELKAKSAVKPMFTIELANGAYGYLPTPEQHELGGYETWLGTNRVEKEASRKIVARLLELLEKVK
jgi:neutral ceramidase